ncbi:hypothetical protein [Plantactinospora sp. KBS50]|uniref:hypothetical protein n=1 Tax=Plantactinospora sp. KBS50 TaxID=2024580 RepID=UPI001E432A32|nr:hypothetical protein [Plantactinospora sp. KBS50]
MRVTVTRKNLLAGMAAAGVLSAGIAVPTLAFADDSGTPGATPSASDSTSTDKGGDRADRQSQFASELAEELGVSQDQVEAALTKIRDEHKPADREDAKGDRGDWTAMLKERLAQAVTDGKLTQEQADAITAAIDAGVFPMGGGPGGHPGPGGWEHGGPDGDGAGPGNTDGGTGDGGSTDEGSTDEGSTDGGK